MSEQVAAQTQTAETPKSDRSGAAKLRRTCACGQHTFAGDMCDECRANGAMLQRRSSSPTVAMGLPLSPDLAPTQESEQPAPSMFAADDACKLEPGQVRKGEFLEKVRTAVTDAMDPILAEVGRSTDGCPYLQFVFRHFARRDVQEMKEALRQFAPDAAEFSSAEDYIPLIIERARQSTERWVATGEISGLPDAVPTSLVSGTLSASGALASVLLFKRRNGSAVREANPESIQTQLGRGRPLDHKVLSRMESGFGRSFAHARIHADANAGQLAGEVNARAFTVGQHVAFATGEYRPGTLVGDTLIAHELAHVVQQDGHNHGIAQSSAPDVATAALEEDADAAAIDGLSGRSASPRLRSGLRLSRCGAARSTTAPKSASTQAPSPSSAAQASGTGQEGPAEQTEAPTPAGPQLRDPNRPLTWDDFHGTPTNSYSAWTRSHHELANEGGVQIIRAVFEPENSWVQPRWANPDDRSLSGCTQNISACQQLFASNPNVATVPLSSTPSATCPAQEVADPTVVATSGSECASVLGPECDRVANAESERLLRHEQLHFDIACVLAAKGTAAIAAHPDMNPTAILNDVTDESNRLCNDTGNEYDTDTNHGCKPTEQADWENKVQQNLPSVTIPVP